MTKEKLEQLIDLRKEIKEIEQKIKQEGAENPSGNANLLKKRKENGSRSRKTNY